MVRTYREWVSYECMSLVSHVTEKNIQKTARVNEWLFPDTSASIVTYTSNTMHKWFKKNNSRLPQFLV